MRYMREDFQFAIEQIDKVLGAGYAKAHPELLAAFIHADGMASAAHVIGTSIDGVAENIRSDHPLMAETFSGIHKPLRTWLTQSTMKDCVTFVVRLSTG